MNIPSKKSTEIIVLTHGSNSKVFCSCEKVFPIIYSAKYFRRESLFARSIVVTFPYLEIQSLIPPPRWSQSLPHQLNGHFSGMLPGIFPQCFRAFSGHFSSVNGHFPGIFPELNEHFSRIKCPFFQTREVFPRLRKNPWRMGMRLFESAYFDGATESRKRKVDCECSLPKICNNHSFNSC